MLSLLDRFQLTGPGGPIHLPNKKLSALLAYMACTAPVPQSREKLATLLWGSHFNTQAQQNLRQALFRLRQVLGPNVFISNDDAIWLAPGAIDCDVAQFRALIREGSLAALGNAVDLYRNDFLADVTLREEAWTDWLTDERRRLEGLGLNALVKLGQLELALAHTNEALDRATRAVAIDGFREDAHRLVIQALAAAGRKAEAIKHYQRIVALFKRELGIEPDAATKLIVAELGRTQPTSSPAAGNGIAEPAPVRSGPQGCPILPFEEISAKLKQKEDRVCGSDAAPAAVAGRSTRPEQRQLTIMHCSLVSSLMDSGQLAPEDDQDLVAEFHERVDEVMERFAGLVAQHIRDGVCVYFGYPEAREHDAEQAVRAGFAVLQLVDTLKAARGVNLQARVSIATGLVVVGEQPGNGDKRQHVVIGETHHLASQLLAAASPGEIVVDASTRQLVGRLFDYRALPSIYAEGKNAPVQVWQVRAETIGVSRFEARRGGELSPLAGRQAKMDLLLRHWKQAKAGEGWVVLLSGEPGIGKSRLAESLLTGLKEEPHSCLRLFCSPHHTHSALYPIIEQLERIASFRPDSSARAKLARLEHLLGPTASNLSRDAAVVADLLAVPLDEHDATLALSPQQKLELTLTVLLEQIEGVAARAPLLIVFEDVHWIDPTSLELLDRIIPRIADFPVLLVITFRPEFQPTWLGLRNVTMLPLSRLGRRDAAAIIGSMAQGKALPVTTVEQILLHSDGVPLYIEELTRSVLESGLQRETTDWVAPIAVPTTLRASLMPRLDRLGSAKNVALIAATIGREFSYELVAAVSGLTPMDLDAALERLTDSGLVYRRGMPPTATYSFKHTMVQDAAYATMLKRPRRQLHAIIAKTLVARFPSVADRLPEVVAHHFAEAGLASEAIDHWVKAGQVAYERGANREAIEFFERGLTLLASLPESRSTLEQALDIHLELPQALIQLGEIPQALLRLHEADRLAERLKDDYRQGQVHSFKAITHALIGELDDALLAGRRALKTVERLDDHARCIHARTILQQVHFYRGEHKRVVALATTNLAALPTDSVSLDHGLATHPSIYDRGRLIISLGELGRFTQAAKPIAELSRLATQTQHAYSVGWAHLAVGCLYLLRGDWAQARLGLDHANAVLTAANVIPLRPLATGLSAWCLAQLGEVDEALSQLREGEELLKRHAENKQTGTLGWFYTWLGRTALVLGRLDDAQQLGDRALAFSPRQPGFAAHALQLLGDVATHPDRWDAECGEAYYRSALVRAIPLGMSPVAAHCNFGLGKLYQRNGASKGANAPLNTALLMYREMDVPFWVEQVEAEIR